MNPLFNSPLLERRQRHQGFCLAMSIFVFVSLMVPVVDLSIACSGFFDRHCAGPFSPVLI